MPITVIKSNGERELFDREKIARTARRAGAKPKLADQVAAEIERRVTDGMLTRDIFRMIMKMLDREAPPVAARYNLEQALYRLGPAGFHFEKYVAKLLAAYDYETRLPEILHGACVTHEVDVIAKKNGRSAMIECKFRNERGIFIGIKDTLATWARFLDLQDGAAQGKTEHFDECWLVTNTRFSRDALAFGQCKGVTLISWNYPADGNCISCLIDTKNLYPITILRSMDERTEQALSSAQVMLVKQLADANPKQLARDTRLPEERARRLIHEAAAILEQNPQ